MDSQVEGPHLFYGSVRAMDDSQHFAFSDSATRYCGQANLGEYDDGVVGYERRLCVHSSLISNNKTSTGILMWPSYRTWLRGDPATMKQ